MCIVEMSNKYNVLFNKISAQWYLGPKERWKPQEDSYIKARHQSIQLLGIEISLLGHLINIDLHQEGTYLCNCYSTSVIRKKVREIKWQNKTFIMFKIKISFIHTCTIWNKQFLLYFSFLTNLFTSCRTLSWIFLTALKFTLVFLWQVYIDCCVN